MKFKNLWLIMMLGFALAGGLGLTAPGCASDEEAAAPSIEPNPSPHGTKDPTAPEHPPITPVAPEDTGEACVPTCDGKQCGPDGCGGGCGYCESTFSCQEGLCVAAPGCEPACAGEMVGAPDGCGGVCSGDGIVVGLKAGGAQNSSWFRSQVAAGVIPPAAEFPMEGWLNEHGTPLPAPLLDRRVTLHGFFGAGETGSGDSLMTLQLGMNSGISPQAITDARLDLVVVVDLSGSMGHGAKLDRVKAGLIAMLHLLDADDHLTLITYSDTASVLLERTAVSDPTAIATLINAMDAKGGTNLWGGLELAYQHASSAPASDSIHHVLLLTDGLVSVGPDETEAILAASNSWADVGLTTIGVGQAVGFDLLYQLAGRSGGNFYHLSESAALETLFMDEVLWLLTPLATDLSIWITPAEGLSITTVHGFEFETDGNRVQLLGPTPQHTVGESAPGGAPGASTPTTLYASREAGLVVAELTGAAPDALPETVATIEYSYRWVDTGEVETWTLDVPRGTQTLFVTGDTWFSDAIVRRGYCVLEAGKAIRATLQAAEASETYPLLAAIDDLDQAVARCSLVSAEEADPQVAGDVTIMTQLRETVCATRSCP